MVWSGPIEPFIAWVADDQERVEEFAFIELENGWAGDLSLPGHRSRMCHDEQQFLSGAHPSGTAAFVRYGPDIRELHHAVTESVEYHARIGTTARHAP